MSSRGSGGALVRFPSRPVLAASVLAALAASGGTVLTMPDEAVVDAAQSAPDLPATPGVPAQNPADAPTVAGPPVSGAQIAGLALAPARERADSLITQRAATEAAAEAAAAKVAAEEQARQEAQQEEQANQNAQRRSGNSQWEQFRRDLRKACDEGRIQGQICRGA
jgi:hypothetical protein